MYYSDNITYANNETEYTRVKFSAWQPITRLMHSAYLTREDVLINVIEANTLKGVLLFHVIYLELYVKYD